MDRRAAVKNMAFLMGGALSATTIGVFLEGCGSPSKDRTAISFSEAQQALIAEIAEIIIPTTNTPGAKEAGVGPFITMMIKDCYPDDAQQVFMKGLEDLENQAKDTYKKSFVEITKEQRQEMLGKLREKTLAATKAESEALAQQQSADSEQQKTNSAKAEKSPTENTGYLSILPKEAPKTEPRFFLIIRDLTLLGYFTSEIGATKAYQYIAVPGRYDGCTELKPGQRVWAT